VSIPAPESQPLLHAVHATVLISAFAIFWFLTFFCLLPIGLGQVDAETGAPVRPRLLFKAGIASVIAAALFIAFYVMILLGWVDL
jgi:predicted secreted protein